LVDGVQWVEPDLLLVSFALRNTGTKPVVVAQLPGVNLDISCSTEDGGFTGRFGGVACVWDGAFLELGPGDALLGKDVVKVPEECFADITVQGDFSTLSAEARDLPAQRVGIHSKPLLIGKRSSREDDEPDASPEKE
jgi:hypothetical protein